MSASLALTEAQWQEQVQQLARVLGWRTMHVRRSIGKGNKWTTATSVKGWPDLTLWSERQQRLVFAELKTESGDVTPEQVEVLASLRAAGQEAYVWRPSDLGRVRDVLSGRKAVAGLVVELAEVEP